MKARKVHEKILAGSRNLRFEDVCGLAEGFGFYRDRISGSHLQPDRNHQAKSYQVRQLLTLVEEHGLTLND